MKLKIKDSVDLSVLLKYRFTDAKDYFDSSDDNCDLFSVYDYVYAIGHSRRGQHYYLLVGKSREINVYGSTPDGSGGVCALPSVILDMVIEGLFE